MKVFDCFTFYKEFDLLELRLEELWDVVDYFVIAEAGHTHQGAPKPYHLLDENWDRFKKYHSKIRHIKVEDMPNTSNAWENENHQRRSLQRGLYDMQPEDLIITGDADEIVRPEVIELIKEDENDYNRYIPFLPLFYFKLNYLMVNPCGIHGKSVVTRGRAFLDPQKERETTFPHLPPPANLDWCFINHGGWHFSYLGDTEYAVNKLKTFAHAETNIPEIVDHINVDEMIKRKVGIGWERGEERFAYVTIEDYMPQYVINNPERWADNIIPNAEFSVYDFYPDIELTPENLDQHVNRTNGTFLQQYRRLVQL